MGRARDLSLLGHHRWEVPGVCLCQDIIDGKCQGFVFAGDIIDGKGQGFVFAGTS